MIREDFERISSDGRSTRVQKYDGGVELPSGDNVEDQFQSR